jgi:hypothetical protein
MINISNLKHLTTITSFAFLLGMKCSFGGVLTPQHSVKLMLLEELRSGRSERASRVNFKVDENVVGEDGSVLIRQGTPAYGTVVRSRKAGAWGRRGILEIEVNYTNAVDGQRVELRGNETKAGNKNKRLITSGAWLVAWPLAFIRGSNVVIKAGSAVVAWVDDNITVGNAKVEVQSKNWPDVFTLKNGNVIMGKMQGLRDGSYSVSTAAGQLTFKASEVVSVTNSSDARPLKKKSASSPTNGKPIFDAAGKQIGSKVAFGDTYRYYDNQGKRIGRMQAKKMGMLN